MNKIKNGAARKFLLAALNAKYIHSNPGIYSLKAYAEAKRAGECEGAACVEAAGSNFPQSGVGETNPPQSEAGETNPPQSGAGETNPPQSGAGETNPPQSGAGETNPPHIEIELGEYTINNQLDDILKDIYLRKPDIVGFSCYIWNISYVLEVARDLPKILPGVDIWLGGPEVSFDAARVLAQEPEITGIMMGEGEETFVRVLECYEKYAADGGKRSELPGALEKLTGVAVRGKMGRIVENPLEKAVDLSTVPFPYGELEDFENRIIYYESSRGCPFSCSYCLSSLDKSVRFREMGLVKRELAFFLERKVPQVKFVDRTFNCSRRHTMEIWSYLTEHDNGVTNFHFEISADLLSEEELALMEKMRPGLIQLEIGVQSTNPDTIREIHRTTDLERLKRVVARIKGFGNIHQHLDLIAGLPYEDYESFGRSFNEVYGMKPDQLQLGFLKVLKGSYMAQMAEKYGLEYKSEPPYEVLKTKWLGYGDVLKLKGVEEMVEVYYNSGQFAATLQRMEKMFPSPFSMFERLAEYYEENHLSGISHSRMARYEILERFLAEMGGDEERDIYRDLLVYDLYLRENLKSRPPFARDQEPYKDRVRAFFAEEARTHRYLKEGYESYEARQLIKMAHLEIFGGDKRSCSTINGGIRCPIMRRLS